MTSITTINAKKKTLLARAGDIALPKITQIAFGDGGVDETGAIIDLEENQVNLNNEIYRKDIAKHEVISGTQIQYYCELLEDELAGRQISEIALVDAEGDLVAIKHFKSKSKDGDFSFLFKVNDTM